MKWSTQLDLNQRPTGYEPVALPTELCVLYEWSLGAESNRIGGPCERLPAVLGCYLFTTDLPKRFFRGGRCGTRTPCLHMPSVFKTDCLPIGGTFLGGRGTIRTCNSFERQISNLLQYHYGTLPLYDFMVDRPGFEPGTSKGTAGLQPGAIANSANDPIFIYGAAPGIRTTTDGILSPVPLPLGYACI